MSFGIGVVLNIEAGYVPQLLRPSRISYPVGQIEFHDRWIIGLVFGLLGGLVLGLFDIWRLETRQDTAKQDKSILQFLLLQTLIIILVIAVSFAFTFGVKLLTVDIFIVVLSYGLCFGAILILRGRIQSLSNDIQTIETLNWSWKGTLKFGSLIGVPLGVLLWAFTNWIGFNYPSTIGLVFVLAGAIFGGLKPGIVETKTTPNQGIRLSIRNSLFTGGIFGIVVSTVIVLAMTLQRYQYSLFGLPLSLTGGVILGLSLGTLAALWYGGLDVIQHYILRSILYFQGKTPQNYIQFLDYAADRIFLQKVGGGYIFIHNLLLDHFAKLEPMIVQANRKRTTVKWLTTALLLGIFCAIVSVFSINTFPQSRDAIRFAAIIEEALELAKQGNIGEALTDFTEAQKVYPNSKIPFYAWNNLCWYGSLRGVANRVLDACEQAVELAPKDAGVRDSRGLARALTGDYVGAVEDFSFFVNAVLALENKEWYEKYGKKRELWIEDLEQGNNPFTKDVLDELLTEEGQ